MEENRAYYYLKIPFFTTAAEFSDAETKLEILEIQAKSLRQLLFAKHNPVTFYGSG